MIGFVKLNLVCVAIGGSWEDNRFHFVNWIFSKFKGLKGA
jgi:hypothetical protein